jgi:hypothetical protein
MPCLVDSTADRRVEMAKKDYSEEEDFYTQGFEKEGVLSVWVALQDHSADKDIDTLQDLCGVGYYRLTDQESNVFDYKLIDLRRLLVDLSYSASYIEDVISAARKIGIEKARRVVVQYDFQYDPEKVTREIAEDPVFLGVFKYSHK